ncbi:PREDICTED: SKP1-like protein 4 [Camelina sativa]|uniref:SKP1-like protein 4 n=1 Tax=Camelina sativa TaxID=90675 RepID=A0ABM0URE1_CAMSA|nr:PREDICTED: SKP1-like protein 4 [Camelina sativa]
MASNKIILKSSDGESFEVDEAVDVESQPAWTTAPVTEPCFLMSPEPATLAKVIKYCKSMLRPLLTRIFCGSTENDKLKTWDTEFVKVDQPTLFDLILAASTCFLQYSITSAKPSIMRLTALKPHLHYHSTLDEFMGCKFY